VPEIGNSTLSLDQHTSCAMIASLRDGATTDRVPGRAFERNEAEKGHQLQRRRKPTYIANLRNKGDGDKERHTPERLVGRHHRRHRSGWHDLTQLLLQGCQASLRRGNSLKLILENNLLGRMTQGLLRQPTFMHFGPIPAIGETPAVAEQE
jgi:hypothetical protein